MSALGQSENFALPSHVNVFIYITHIVNKVNRTIEEMHMYNFKIYDMTER